MSSLLWSYNNQKIELQVSHLLDCLPIHFLLIIVIEQIFMCKQSLFIPLTNLVVIHGWESSCLSDELLHFSVQENSLEFWWIVGVLPALHIEIKYTLYHSKYFITSFAHSHNLHKILHLVHACIKARNDHFFSELSSVFWEELCFHIAEKATLSRRWHDLFSSYTLHWPV